MIFDMVDGTISKLFFNTISRLRAMILKLALFTSIVLVSAVYAYSQNDTLDSMNEYESLDDFEYVSKNRLIPIDTSAFVKFSTVFFKNTFPSGGVIYGKKRDLQGYKRIGNYDSVQKEIKIFTSDFDSIIFAQVYVYPGQGTWKRKESHKVEENKPFEISISEVEFGELNDLELIVRVFNAATHKKTVRDSMVGKALYEVEISDAARPFRIEVKPLQESEGIIEIEKIKENRFRVVFVASKETIDARQREFQKNKRLWEVPIGILMIDPLTNESRRKDIVLKRMVVEPKKVRK